MADKFILRSDFQPTGDQPAAIASLVDGVRRGERMQTLLGVTGSGKTFTMANVIAELNRLSVTPMPLSDREQTEPTSPAADSSADSSAESPEDHALPPTPDADDTEERSRAASHPRPRRDLPVEGEKKGEAHDEE